MSHFTCLVILPKGTKMKNAEDAAARLLQPYDENESLQGRWDWWVVGGRWDGWIFGPERKQACRDNKQGFNFGKEHQKTVNNCRPVSEIPFDDRRYVPFAVLTPEGEWHEIGCMCQLGPVSNPKDAEEWLPVFREVMTKYAGHLAIAIDCHE